VLKNKQAAMLNRARQWARTLFWGLGLCFGYLATSDAKSSYSCSATPISYKGN